MTEPQTHDLIIPGENKLQRIYYTNPLFYCLAQNNTYPTEMSYNIPEHWHEDLEFLYVSSGEMEYSVNGNPITLHAGEGIFVPPRRIHANRSPIGSSCDFYYLLLHPTYLCVSPYIERTYVAPLFDNESFEYLFLNNNDWTKEILTLLLDLFAQISKKEFELSCLGTAFHILQICTENMKANIQSTPTSGLYVGTFKQMVTFINDHYMEKISLDDISASGNVGKTLCAKIFRKFTSCTPGDYLIHYRITKSMNLLTDSELSITEIAYATGFNSASHFTKTFRELIGCSPKKYRNEPQNTGTFLQHF